MKNLIELLTGPYDQNNALLSFHAGVGGTDAQDWTEMLCRMYLRFCQKKNWQSFLIDESKGSEAGLKSALLEIVGPYAYGFLKSESGVHRLVRISPFDAEKMRHTSFALVDVLPEIEAPQIIIKDQDLKIETFRASGKGGQNIQKVETAVRLTHLPSQITVACQAERSQHQNKMRALKILKSKLVQLAQAKKEEEKERIRGKIKPASWGNQIRSYILQPYKLVKDHRTKIEIYEAQKVLDGDLDRLIEGYLKKFSSAVKAQK